MNTSVFNNVRANHLLVLSSRHFKVQSTEQ